MIRYYGEQNVPGAPGQTFLAGNPSFDINRRQGALGGRSGEQLKRLYEGGTQQNQQLNEELRLRNLLPGVQLPMSMGGMQPMGNAGAFVDNAQMFMGPQFGQMPVGFQNKFVS